MGEARRRGSFAERKKNAIKRNKAKILEVIRGKSKDDDAALRAGITPF